MFRALFLDLDDTLFDRAAAFARWATARFGAAEVPWLVAADDHGRRAREDFAADVAARYGVALADFPRELAEHVAPEPGVREVLAALASAGTAIAVVTNGGAAQRDKLERTGVADLVKVMFVSSELGIAKPDPAIFARAHAWANVQPWACLVAGDDPANDIAPAASLGMRTAWVARGRRWLGGTAPTYTLATLAELRGAIAGAAA